MTSPDHAESAIVSLYGESVLHCFSWGSHEEENVLAVVAGDPGRVPLVRVQSACYSAEIFRSLDCDCHEQLDTSLRRIHSEGGVVVYMLCDGRGAGLLTKIRGLALGTSEGLDTAEAYERLGVEPDPRRYDRVACVLKKLGITRLRLLTNNPRKIDGLLKSGLVVERERLEIPATPSSRSYLETKRDKLGHLLDL
jgi:GTP cyclohydrolase II